MKKQFLSIQNIILHIDNNLEANLDAEFLSKVGYVSRSQLYRDFYNFTGHSVKEYVRKRRLSNALALIKTSEFSLADIACQCGYSSQQALCRAVRQTLDMTPLAYRDSEVSYFFPPFRGAPLCGITVSSETIPQTLCLSFLHSSLKGIEERAVGTLLKVIPDYSGRIFGRNGKQNGRRFCYKLYLTDFQRDYHPLEQYGFEIIGLQPAFTSTFALSTVPNKEQSINTAWNYLYAEWLQKSMFEYTSEPYYEEYLLRGGKPTRLKLYLPICKRAENTKITLIINPGMHFVAAEAKGQRAEKTASKTIIDFLTNYHPVLMKTSREFYLHKGINFCVCGVRIHPEQRIAEHPNIQKIATDEACYLVLESRVMGDYDCYAEMLLGFAADNALTVRREDIFTIYDASESFDNPKFKMFCQVRSNNRILK